MSINLAESLTGLAPKVPVPLRLSVGQSGWEQAGRAQKGQSGKVICPVFHPARAAVFPWS